MNELSKSIISIGVGFVISFAILTSIDNRPIVQDNKNKVYEIKVREYKNQTYMPLKSLENFSLIVTEKDNVIHIGNHIKWIELRDGGISIYDMDGKHIKNIEIMNLENEMYVPADTIFELVDK
jgi:hypothetical protein